MQEFKYKNIDYALNSETIKNNGPYFVPPKTGTTRSWKARLTWWLLTLLAIILVLYMSFYPQFNTDDNDDYICPEKLSLNGESYYNYTAEQIHLSLGRDETELIITWSIQLPISCKVVYYTINSDGTKGRENLVDGSLTTWTSVENDPDVITATRTMHMDHYTYRAKLSGLKPETRYTYTIISNDDDIETSSREYEFITKNLTNPNANLSIAFFGDLGIVNGQSIPRLIRDVDNKMYDFIIHNGDFAYDMNTHHGTYGDQFMRLIEPIAARVPYQTSVGNHEEAEKFLHYDQRFSMVNSGGHDVGKQNNFFYSFNAGPIHFVSISTEHWYFMHNIGLDKLQAQWSWLEADLEKANNPDQRALRPWIVVFGHRPMYCSSRDRDDCAHDTCLLRKGLPFLGTYALEKLLYESSVDIELWSHEHQYERFLPLYDGVVYNGTSVQDEPYHDPRAPVHLISGSAGCQERLDPFKSKHAPGSVVRLQDYGYTRIKVQSACRIEFEQISDDQNGTVVDRFVVTKTQQNFPYKSALERCRQ